MLWILVIESKQSKFDVTSGIPQALSYMLNQPSDSDRFGMVSKDREVVFLKLNSQQSPVYTQSKIYQVIETEEDLSYILQDLKMISKQFYSH